jgi:hypothetical protein
MSAMNIQLASLGASIIFVLAGCVTQQRMSYQRDVIPIIEAKCLDCHTPPNGTGYLRSRLSMESYEALMEGTIYGPVIVASDSRHSILNMLVEGRLDLPMRTPHPLNTEEIETFRLWVDQGALKN